jgi:hypothetical protein
MNAPEQKDDDLPERSVDKCDDCGEQRPGIMRYAFQRSKGKFVPVLFICNDCEEAHA